MKISDPKGLILENNVHIGEGAYFYTRGSIIIKEHAHLSRNVTIYSANHSYEANALPYDDKFSYKPVIIGRGVWIGRNVNILPGVKIGDGAIIGMGSTISSDVKPYEIVTSNPQKVVKKRDELRFLENLSFNNFGDKDGKLIPDTNIADFYIPINSKKINQVFLIVNDQTLVTELQEALGQIEHIQCIVNDKMHMQVISHNYQNKVINYEQTVTLMTELYELCLSDGSLYYIEIHKNEFPITHILHKILPNSKTIYIDNREHPIAQPTLTSSDRVLIIEDKNKEQILCQISEFIKSSL
nr:acyltransferase [Endozoicomonas sp. G2_1]